MKRTLRTSSVSVVRVDPEKGPDQTDDTINGELAARAQDPDVVEVRIAGIIPVPKGGAWVIVEAIRETITEGE